MIDLIDGEYYDMIDKNGIITRRNMYVAGYVAGYKNFLHCRFEMDEIVYIEKHDMYYRNNNKLWEEYQKYLREEKLKRILNE